MKLNNFFSPLLNCEISALQFCNILKLNITKKSIVSDVKEHPYYPSMLSISDMLNSYKVDNISLKTRIEHFIKLPLPLLAQIHDSDIGVNMFAVIRNTDLNNIEWYNPELDKVINSTHLEFSKLFTGYVLIAEVNEKSGERNFVEKKSKDITSRIITGLLSSLMIVLLFGISAMSFVFLGLSANSLQLLFSIFTLFGVIMSVILIWHEIDKKNLFVQNVCHAFKKSNCDEILNSKYANVFNISWASIGFTYFSSSLLMLIICGIYNHYVLYLESWLTIMSLPYIGYSLYYQMKIAKSWCPMCLFILGVLLCQFLCVIIGEFYQLSSIDYITIYYFLFYILCNIIVFSFLRMFINIFKIKESNRKVKRELIKLKYNQHIFKYLQQNQNKLMVTPDNLGIIIGNATAKNTLIKVCSPYCTPCSRVYLEVEDLIINNPDIKLQIIFVGSEDNKSLVNFVIGHLLTVAKYGNQDETIQALYEWFNTEKKDYEIFSKKFPINSNPIEQNHQILEMLDWSIKVGIRYTPTFYYNNFQLPDIYHVADLKYFLEE